MNPETMLSRCLDAAIYDRTEEYEEEDNLESEECWREDR